MTESRFNVLIVDADMDRGRRVCQWFHADTDAQWSAQHGASLDSALRKIQASSFDAIVFAAPCAAGDERESRRQLHAVAEVPIIALTDDVHLADAPHLYLPINQLSEPVLVQIVRLAIERARVEQQHHQSKQGLAAMERMIAVVGHEMRTPLAGLRATTEFLLTDAAKQAEEWDAFLQLMHDEVLRLAEFANNVLESARLNSGQTQWHWETVKLSAACDGALNVVRPLIDHGEVELHWHIDPPDLTMLGDPDAICRLIINFISNAAKHTTEGSITLEVCRQMRDARPHVVMRFIDTGTGIPPKIVEKLGKAFVLNDGSIGSDYSRGIGLGLSICRGIVAAHGGSIAVESRPDRGSTFTVTLPTDLPGPATTNDTEIQTAAA